MKTTIKTASVNVMLSYDYCHFETSMTLENDKGVTKKELDDARKECMRLCDKAIVQYKKAKVIVANRDRTERLRSQFIDECNRIEEMTECDRTPEQKAQLSRYENEEWEKHYQLYYDYDDEEL